MRFEQIALSSRQVGETSGRLAKIQRLAACLARLGPDEIPVAVAYLSGELPQGSIGVGWASLRDLPAPAAGPPGLELLDVHRSLGAVANATGSGSQAVRRRELSGLFARATGEEARFLTALLLGELRQGALEGVMVEAVARASSVAVTEIRRALMLSGDLGTVASAAITRGRDGLAGFRLTVLRPVQPMLAQTADGLTEALGRVDGPASVEWKLDGARVQVHRLGSEVRAFTRNLADVTGRVPELVETVGALPVDSVILDGEAIALRSDGSAHPFGVTMSRFGSRLGVEQARTLVPMSAFFFDCLHLDGDDLIDRPAVDRFAAMETRLAESLRVPRLTTEVAAEAEAFLEDTLARGHEGVMVKALQAPYEAGRRGASWLKVKRAHTLDLVVLAAEWGHGRRRGWLSNLHLGARDPGNGAFVMLGKTFKGMTDRMLSWQTERLLELEVRRDDWTVHVRPELVVEVAFDGLLPSPKYPAGLALRFARIKAYRPDKRPEDADTIDTVRAIHAGSPPDPPRSGRTARPSPSSSP